MFSALKIKNGNIEENKITKVFIIIAEKSNALFLLNINSF
jgi:hypothetical protein